MNNDFTNKVFFTIYLVCNQRWAYRHYRTLNRSDIGTQITLTKIGLDTVTIYIMKPVCLMVNMYRSSNSLARFRYNENGTDGYNSRYLACSEKNNHCKPIPKNNGVTK